MLDMHHTVMECKGKSNNKRINKFIICFNKIKINSKLI